MNHAIHRTTDSYTRMANECHIDQRTCLSCGWWMRSYGPGHRICNQCKGDRGGTAMRVGNRIRPVDTYAQADAWQWNQKQADLVANEYANVLNLEGEET